MLTIVKKNDSYDAITYQLENEDNSTVDLTGASVNFVMGKKNKLITNAKATVTSATSGIVSYQLTPLDTLVSGTFLAEFVVTFANGTVKTYPSNGYITVDVEQNLDTSQNNVVLDMIATKQGDFEAKLDSILKQGIGTQVSAMNEYTWTATSGQTIFVFPTNAKYDPSAKWFQVSVGNVPIANELINRASSSQFSLVVDPSLIVAGMTVHAMWVEPIVPITGGHHSTHEINGQDEINIANLRNYQELVATPIASNTTALADKASKSDLQQVSLSFKESYATLSALQTAYPSGDVYNHAVTADGIIYTYKNGWISTGIQANGTGVINGSITPVKTTFAEQIGGVTQTNMFDSTSTIAGQGVLPTAGTNIDTLVAVSDAQYHLYGTSGIIALEANTTYTISFQPNWSRAYMDLWNGDSPNPTANPFKQYYGYVSLTSNADGTKSFTTPSIPTFTRVQFSSDTFGNASTFKFVKGTQILTATGAISYRIKNLILDDKSVVESNLSQDLMNKITSGATISDGTVSPIKTTFAEQIGEILFDSSTCISGKAVFPTAGTNIDTLVSTDGTQYHIYGTSGIISLEANTVYTMSFQPNWSRAYADLWNGQTTDTAAHPFKQYYGYVPLTSNADGTFSFTTPSIPTFTRIQFSDDKFGSASTFNLVKGSQITSTGEVGYRIKSLILDDKSIPTKKMSFWYKGKKITTYGDSITAMFYWQPFVQDYFNIGTVVNRGIGSTSVHNNGLMTNVDANGAYSSTGTQIESWMCSDQRIATIPSDSDVIIIMAGTNDWGSTLGSLTVGDNTPLDDNFYGAYQLMIGKIRQRFPNAYLICVTPSNGRVWTHGTDVLVPPVNYNQTIRQLADAAMDVCRNYSIPCIDLNGESQFSFANSNDYLQDATHPSSTKGAYALARTIINGMKRFEPIDFV